MYFALLIISMESVMGQTTDGACSLEGCSPQHDSWTNFVLPSHTSISLQWSYNPPLLANIPGSGSSCSGNGVLTVCTMNHTTGVVALNSKGKLVWSSDEVFGSPKFADSAPVIDYYGCSSVQDGLNVIYFDPKGEILWHNEVAAETEPGSLFAQGSTGDGLLPTHIGIGSLAIYETATGLCWASIQLGFNETTNVWYEAVATVANSNERTYIPTAIHSDTSVSNSSDFPGALFCVLSTHDRAMRFKMQWSWPCRPIPYQAPTVYEDTDGTIIVMFFATESQSFDQDRVFLYALRDSTKPKTMPSLLWRKQIDPSSLGIMIDRSAKNVGAWIYDSFTKNLLFLKISTGDIIRTIQLTSLGISLPPISFGTLGISPNKNTILVTCFGGISRNNSTQYENLTLKGVVVAIDLTDGKILWKFDDTTTGQIVPMQNDKKPLLVYKNIRGVIQAIS